MTQPHQRREIILLNLKWFVNRLPKVFESRLSDIMERHSNCSSQHYSPRHLPSSLREKHASLLNSPILRHFSLPGTPRKSQKPLLLHNGQGPGGLLGKPTSASDSRLVQFYNNSTEPDRHHHLNHFASHLCLIYEYQLGMLKGYKSVKAVVDFVVDVLLKALRLGVIDNLEPTSGLHPGLLYDLDLHPTAGELWVKTSPVGVHNDSLSWKISELFTCPGLRYNEVIGQGCHNLSIVTHFLAPYSTTGINLKHPEVYGYRNMIVLPAFPPNNTDDDNTTRCSSFDSTECLHSRPYQYHRQFPLDSATIKHNQILGTMDSTSNSSNVTTTFLQHLHKSYQPIFFLLYDRSEVMEHLIECETFARFCSTHKLTPVMFISRYIENLTESPSLEYFHNFDVFKISSTQFLPAVKLNKNTLYSTPPASPLSTPSRRSSALKNQVIISAYDNPAFLC